MLQARTAQSQAALAAPPVIDGASIIVPRRHCQACALCGRPDEAGAPDVATAEAIFAQSILASPRAAALIRCGDGAVGRRPRARHFAFRPDNGLAVMLTESGPHVEETTADKAQQVQSGHASS